MSSPVGVPVPAQQEVLRRQSRQYVRYVSVLVHRVLAQHRPFERCDECPEANTDE